MACFLLQKINLSFPYSDSKQNHLTKFWLPLWNVIAREGAHDFLLEVIKMSLVEISREVDSWIDEEELPVRDGLKPVSGFDPYEGMDEEEIEAYLDFMHWFLNREHAVLLLIPKQKSEYDFWSVELDEFGCDVSAFNTVDFERLYPDTFSKYHYRLQKIFERVKDLAIMHSVLNSEEGRANTFNKYQSLLEKEFRGQLVRLAQRFERETDELSKSELRQKIAKLNRQILECKKIWEQYAPRDI
jgi:hypothetical protein